MVVCLSVEPLAGLRDEDRREDEVDSLDASEREDDLAVAAGR